MIQGLVFSSCKLMMETVDTSLSGGCDTLGNSQEARLQPSVFLNCCLSGIAGGGGREGRFSLVSLMLLHILCKNLCPCSVGRQESSCFAVCGSFPSGLWLSRSWLYFGASSKLFSLAVFRMLKCSVRNDVSWWRRNKQTQAACGEGLAALLLFFCSFDLKEPDFLHVEGMELWESLCQGAWAVHASGPSRLGHELV